MNLTDYMSAISRYSPLTDEEDRSARGLLATAGPRADALRCRLIEGLLSHVAMRAWIQQLLAPQLDLMDLIQEGNLALVEASMVYAVSGAGSFSAYALPRIEDALRRATGSAVLQLNPTPAAILTIPRQPRHAMLVAA